MKLTDANKIRDYVKEEINPYGKPFEGSVYEFGLKIMHYIDNMPTAYDTDKVVDKLKKIKGQVCIDIICRECEYASDCFEGGESEKVAIDKAIEIVKEGVENDKCGTEKIRKGKTTPV